MAQRIKKTSHYLDRIYGTTKTQDSLLGTKNNIRIDNYIKKSFNDQCKEFCQVFVLSSNNIFLHSWKIISLEFNRYNLRKSQINPIWHNSTIVQTIWYELYLGTDFILSILRRFMGYASINISKICVFFNLLSIFWKSKIYMHIMNQAFIL